MKERITQDEIEFAELMLDPVWKMGVFFSDFEGGKIWSARKYQEDLLLDESDSVNMCAARGVGKSESIVADILDVMLKNPYKEGVITTPRQAHIVRTWDLIRTRTKKDPVLRDLIQSSTKGPDYYFQFNNFKLYGRIAGSSGGESLLSLHVDYIWVDEAQLYMPDATTQMQGIMNEGCKVKSFGVPNGVRKSFLYKTFADDKYSHHKVVKFEDPSFTDEDHQRRIKIYGGKHTQAYKNQILAEWGESTNVTFPEKFWRACKYNSYSYEPTILDGNNFDKHYKNKFRDLDLPEPTRIDCPIEISGDLGFDPDPTILCIWNIIDEKEVLIHRIRMNKVEYFKQSEFIDFIARHYGAQRVTLDEGNAGRSVIQELNETYCNNDYTVVAVKFGGTIDIGKDSEGKSIMKRIKFYSTILLERAFEEKTIQIPEQDLELLEEIHNSTQRCTGAGNYVYEGVDHCLDAMRCQIVSRYITKDSDGTRFIGLAMVSF